MKLPVARDPRGQLLVGGALCTKHLLERGRFGDVLVKANDQANSGPFRGPLKRWQDFSDAGRGGKRDGDVGTLCAFKQALYDLFEGVGTSVYYEMNRRCRFLPRHFY
jgi:hypothetical protein